MPEDIKDTKLISPNYSADEKSLIRSSVLEQATAHVVQQFEQTHSNALRQYERLGYFNQPGFFRDLLFWANGLSTWEKKVNPGFKDFLYRFSHRENGPAELESLRIFLRTQISKVDSLLTLLFDLTSKSEQQRALDTVPSNKKERTLKIEVSAFYQEFSQFLYRVNCARDERGFNDPFFRSIQTITNLIMEIGKVRDIENENKEFLKAFNGIRAQAGLCRALEKAGYMVLMPDPQNKTEVENWDHRGNDMVAIDTEGNILLIDCKGYFFDQKSGERILTPRAIPEAMSLRDAGPVLADTLEYLQSYLKKAKSNSKLTKSPNATNALKRFVLAQKGQASVNVTKLQIIIPNDEQLLSSTGIMDEHVEEKLYEAIQDKIN